MAPDPPTKHPRVSKRVQHGVEIVLAVIWLGGVAYLREVLHTGWTEPIILLVAVLVIEVVFVIWNHGGVKAAAEADQKPSTG
jgi:hypothetical protein